MILFIYSSKVDNDLFYINLMICLRIGIYVNYNIKCMVLF